MEQLRIKYNLKKSPYKFPKHPNWQIYTKQLIKESHKFEKDDLKQLYYDLEWNGQLKIKFNQKTLQDLDLWELMRLDLPPHSDKSCFLEMFSQRYQRLIQFLKEDPYYPSRICVHIRMCSAIYKIYYIYPFTCDLIQCYSKAFNYSKLITCVPFLDCIESLDKQYMAQTKIRPHPFNQQDQERYQDICDRSKILKNAIFLEHQIIEQLQTLTNFELHARFKWFEERNESLMENQDFSLIQKHKHNLKIFPLLGSRMYVQHTSVIKKKKQGSKKKAEVQKHSFFLSPRKIKDQYCIQPSQTFLKSLNFTSNYIFEIEQWTPDLLLKGDHDYSQKMQDNDPFQCGIQIQNRITLWEQKIQESYYPNKKRQYTEDNTIIVQNQKYKKQITIPQLLQLPRYKRNIHYNQLAYHNFLESKKYFEKSKKLTIEKTQYNNLMLPTLQIQKDEHKKQNIPQFKQKEEENEQKNIMEVKDRFEENNEQIISDSQMEVYNEQQDRIYDRISKLKQQLLDLQRQAEKRKIIRKQKRKKEKQRLKNSTIQKGKAILNKNNSQQKQIIKIIPNEQKIEENSFVGNKINYKNNNCQQKQVQIPNEGRTNEGKLQSQHIQSIQAKPKQPKLKKLTPGQLNIFIRKQTQIRRQKNQGALERMMINVEESNQQQQIPDKYEKVRPVPGFHTYEEEEEQSESELIQIKGQRSKQKRMIQIKENNIDYSSMKHEKTGHQVVFSEYKNKKNLGFCPACQSSFQTSKLGNHLKVCQAEIDRENLCQPQLGYKDQIHGLVLVSINKSRPFFCYQCKKINIIHHKYHKCQRTQYSMAAISMNNKQSNLLKTVPYISSIKDNPNLINYFKAKTVNFCFKKKYQIKTNVRICSEINFQFSSIGNEVLGTLNFRLTNKGIKSEQTIKKGEYISGIGGEIINHEFLNKIPSYKYSCIQIGCNGTISSYYWVHIQNCGQIYHFSFGYGNCRMVLILIDNQIQCLLETLNDIQEGDFIKVRNIAEII